MSLLCGDEIQACIIDIGNTSIKFGTAGEDLPRHVIRSDIGFLNSENQNQYIFGDLNAKIIKENIEITKHVQSDGSINWDCMDSLLQYGLCSSMYIDPAEYPILMAESCFESVRDKEKLLEICFETLSTPAFYMASNGVLSSFSTGRPTSLVVDFGASETRVYPIVDGYILKKGVNKTLRGGNMLDDIIKKHIETFGINITPLYEVKTKARQYPSISSLHASFHEMHVYDIVRDLKHSMSIVPNKQLSSDLRSEFFSTLTIDPYELPDGTIIYGNDALCTSAEQLWFPSTLNTINITSTNSNHSNKRMKKEEDTLITSRVLGGPGSNNHESCSLDDLIYESLLLCDVDVRRELLSNLVVVGGGSLIEGVCARVAHQLADRAPAGYKTKAASLLPVERQFSSWIGGSILSICGSFQQLWISSDQYGELGGGLLAYDRLVH